MSEPTVHKQPPPPYSPQPPPGYGFSVPPPPPPVVNSQYAYGVPEQQRTGYGSAVITVQQPAVIINGCPSCRAGVLMDEYSCLGIFCAIFFFPLGVLCCLTMRERRCSNCNATF